MLVSKNEKQIQCNSDVFLSGLRVEWAKSHARALRWIEELTLLREEMRRVLTYFQWKAYWWSTKAKSHPSDTGNVQEGFKAYANRQISILQKLAVKFKTEWEKKSGVKGLPVFDELDLLKLQNDDEMEVSLALIISI